MSTVSTLKEQNPAFQPLLLAYFTFQGTNTTLAVSSVPLDGVSNPAFPGIGILPAGNYIGRIAQQDIGAFQQRSNQGIDGIAKITLNLWDADHFIWSNYVIGASETAKYGFRGASVQIALVMWQAGTSNFSSDAPVMFTGSCDMEVLIDGGSVLRVSANNSHYTATVKLPMWPVQNRCPWVFPTNATQRAAASSDPTSKFYLCGYSADQTNGYGNIATVGGPANDGKNIVDTYGNQVTDANGVYIMCPYIRSGTFQDAQGHTGLQDGCMARLGNPSVHTYAPDGDIMHDIGGHLTGAFGGVQYAPGTYFATALNFTSNSNIPVFNFTNSAVLGQYHNLLYGTQFVNAKVANILESGNDTKCEAMICQGDIGQFGVSLVIVNGIQLARTPSGDNNLFWDFANLGGTTWSTGGRNGIVINGATAYGFNDSSGHLGLGDPYGNIARIICVFYKDIFTGYGVPNIQVLATGSQVKKAYPITSAVGDGTKIVVTLPTGTNETVGNPPFTVSIVGNTWATVNNAWQLTTWAFGPPPTVTLANSAFTGSGTGGFYLTPVISNNPVWVLMDILTECNWNIAELDLNTFIAAASYCDASIGYVNKTGQPSTHARYKCQFVLEQRKTAAEVISAVLRSFNGYLAIGQNGLLQVYINQTLGDSQSTAITGSNYNTPINSVTAGGTGSQSVTGASWTSSVATLTIGTHTLSNINSVTVSGINPSGYNGTYPITSVTSTTISYALVSNPGAYVSGGSIQVVGYVAYSFDETNVRRMTSGGNELPDITSEENATILTPNQIFITFQDEDNQYVIDSLGQIDAPAVARSGGALQPGGSVVPETMNVLGISNFDQAIRIANVYLAERQRGNEAGDPRGTRVFTIGTTIKCEHLRVGHLVWFSWQAFNINQQLFRVTKITTTTNGETWHITFQWHVDLWYTDIYGQAPEAFASFTGTNRPMRAPLPWQPNHVAYNSSMISTTEYNFGIAEIDTTQADGSTLVQAKVSGMLPVNNPSSLIQPPITPTQATFSNAAGTIPAGSYLIQICGVDASGNYSAPSGTTSCYTTATGEITISGIQWSSQTNGYDVFVGTTHFNLTHQVSATPGIGSMPSSITLTSLPNVLTYAPPDLAAGEMKLQAKWLIHEGIIGVTVASVNSTSITLGAAPTNFTNNIANHYVILVGRPGLNGAELPLVDFKITSNTTGTTTPVLTLDRNPVGVLAAGDVVAISCIADISSATTIGDSNAVTSYEPTGFTSADVGKLVRIIAGKGRYQIRTIASVTSTTYTVTVPWNTVPDSTSVFIVEDSTWVYEQGSTVQINTTGYVDGPAALLNMSNLSGIAVIIQALIGDPGDTKFSNQYRSPFRMLWIFGTAASGNTPPGNVTISSVTYSWGGLNQ